MFRVAIINNDDNGNFDFFAYKCAFFLRDKVKMDKVMVNSIGNSQVKKFCSTCGIDMQTFNTDWKKYGKEALKVRNEDLLSNSDAVIIFDNGTKDIQMIIKMATEKGLPLRKIKI